MRIGIALGFMLLHGFMIPARDIKRLSDNDPSVTYTESYLNNTFVFVVAVT